MLLSVHLHRLLTMFVYIDVFYMVLENNFGLPLCIILALVECMISYAIYLIQVVVDLRPGRKLAYATIAVRILYHVMMS